VQTFTTILVGLASFLSLGALAHLIAKACRGKGSFEATFISLVLANVIPSFSAHH
jgi:cation transporter-like permease